MIRVRNNPADEQYSGIREPIERKNSNGGTPRRATGSIGVAASLGQISAGSLQIYHNLQKRRKKRYSEKGDSSASWTVDLPKRTLLSTLGIFLIFPILVFVWKEIHPNTPKATEQLRGGRQELKKRNRYVSWMEDNLPEYNETAEVGAIFLPEPIVRSGEAIANATKLPVDGDIDRDVDNDIKPTKHAKYTADQTKITNFSPNKKLSHAGLSDSEHTLGFVEHPKDQFGEINEHEGGGLKKREETHKISTNRLKIALEPDSINFVEGHESVLEEEYVRQPADRAGDTKESTAENFANTETLLDNVPSQNQPNKIFSKSDTQQDSRKDGTNSDLSSQFLPRKSTFSTSAEAQSNLGITGTGSDLPSASIDIPAASIDMPSAAGIGIAGVAADGSNQRRNNRSITKAPGRSRSKFSD